MTDLILKDQIGCRKVDHTGQSLCHRQSIGDDHQSGCNGNPHQRKYPRDLTPQRSLDLGNPLKRTYFALQPSYEVEGRILAQYAIDELKPERVVVFHVETSLGWKVLPPSSMNLLQDGINPSEVIA